MTLTILCAYIRAKNLEECLISLITSKQSTTLVLNGLFIVVIITLYTAFLASFLMILTLRPIMFMFDSRLLLNMWLKKSQVAIKR